MNAGEFSRQYTCRRRGASRAPVDDRTACNASRLMQNPLGAAFARKVLRCKARDEGRTLVLFDEERNAAAGHFSRKPFGAVLGGAICFVASLANSQAIRLRLASRISPRQAAPRPHGVLHQPAISLIGTQRPAREYLIFGSLGAAYRFDQCKFADPPAELRYR